MKLKIDEWIEDNKFSTKVNVLLKDSSVCYKAGAYRASLLFSYLGFLTVLKERIISGVKPKNYEQGHWDNLISKLQNDEKWEQAIFDATQQQAKTDQQTKAIIRDPIFSINEDIREQIKYWRQRRNDCAHYKENNISYYHTESFWAFMESNLSRITIEGSLITLVNKIKDHFNPTLTPPGKNITYLVEDIEHSVPPIQLNEFWNTLIAPTRWGLYLSKEIKGFLSECFKVSTEDIKKSIVNKLKENTEFLLDFIDSYPETILHFNFDNKEVRRLWSTDLKKSNNQISIYASLLNNNLIPEEEIKEANKTIIGFTRDYNPNFHEQQVMMKNDFLNTFKSEIIDNDNFVGYKSYLWINERADLICGVMKSFPADTEILNRLVEHYNQSFSSEWLLKRFDYLIESNDKVIEAYKRLKISEGITLPAKLNKYFA